MSKHEITKCDLCDGIVEPKDIAGKIDIDPKLEFEQLRFGKEEVCFQCLAIIRNTIDGLVLKAKKVG